MIHHKNTDEASEVEKRDKSKSLRGDIEAMCSLFAAELKMLQRVSDRNGVKGEKNKWKLLKGYNDAGISFKNSYTLKYRRRILY
ncbi:hypothetical protein DMENIID0001_134220 [Sergentomyia squamirostris]